MPAKSKNQLKLIWSIRNKYKSKTKAPKKWKWVFEEEWGHLAESHMFSFDQFNEAMATLGIDDTDLLEDLCLGFTEDWNLEGSWDEKDYEPFEKMGYLSIQRFDKYHIQFTVQIYVKKGEIKDKRFESDLILLVNRIGKFGFSVMQITWGSSSYYGSISTPEVFDQFTYSFQISHTDGKSMEILSTNESLSIKDEYLHKCWHDAKIGQVLGESDIYKYVEQLHRNEEDFYDGDLGQRIEQFSKYKLTEIPIDKINIDEWDLDIDYMKDYKKMFRESNDYPPIVLDGDRSGGITTLVNDKWVTLNNYTIIDGTHRVNALDRLKIKTVKSWVGFN